MARVGEEVAAHDGVQLLLVRGVARGEHVLHHVVAVLVRDERLGAGVQVGEHVGAHGVRAVLEHALHDAAAVGVRGQVLHLVRERVDDELDVLEGDALDGLLDDVVAVLVFDALLHVAVKLSD